VRRPRFSIFAADSEGGARLPGPTTASLERQRFAEWEACEDAAEAGGEFLLPLDAGDVLADDALAALAEALDAHPDADLLYSDEAGALKPGFSPERLRAQMYLGRLLALRRTLVDELGGWGSAAPGAMDWDMALRVSERAREVRHVARPLCRRAAGTTAAGWRARSAAAAEAVESHCRRVGLQARVEPDPERPGLCHLRPALAREPRVTLVIPTGGGRRRLRGEPTVLVENCVRSIVSTSTYGAYEIVVVADGSTDPELLSGLEQAGGGRLRTVVDERPFNFSQRINLAAASSGGDHLLLLNDDTEVVTADWIERLVMYSELDGVGAVGAQLRTEDGRIQHAGIVFEDGLPGHVYHGEREPLRGYSANALVPQNYLAVTGACLITSRAAFEQVGGLSEKLPVNYNDVDYCLRQRAEGRRVVYDADTVLHHFESSSRSSSVRGWERELLLERWGDGPARDPYSNPGLRYGRPRTGALRRLPAAAWRRLRR
jgi:GT2 family glycosyltransferase